MEFGPLRVRERPVLLVTNNELLARMPDVELHARLLVPAIALAFQEIVEEFLLQADSVISVVMRPMLDAVHLEPFLFRRRPVKTLEVAARMQRLATPVRCGKHRHLHLRPVRPHCCVEIVVEGMRKIGLSQVVTVRAHLLRVQCFRSRHPVAVHAATVTFGGKTVLHRLDLHVLPILREGIVDAAVVAELTIEISETLPDTDGREMLWLQARDLPLVDGVIRNPAQTDPAVRPRLLPGPLDAVMEVLRFTRRPMLDITGRAAATA